MVHLIGQTIEEQALEYMRGKGMMQGLVQHAIFQYDAMDRAIEYAPDHLEVSYAMLPPELQKFLKMEAGQSRKLVITTTRDRKFTITINNTEQWQTPCWQWSGGKLKGPSLEGSEELYNEMKTRASKDRS